LELYIEFKHQLISVTGPLCSQSAGTCQYQCKPGFYGHNCLLQCINQCVDDTCNITTGECEECKTTSPGMMCRTGSKWCNVDLSVCYMMFKQQN